MPEHLYAMSVDSILNTLEHTGEGIRKTRNLESLKNVLEKNDNLSSSLKRVLKTIMADLNSNYTEKAIEIILVILRKVKAGIYTQGSITEELVDTALLAMNTLKTASSSNNDHLKTLCIDLLENYPDDIFATIFHKHRTQLVSLMQVYSCKNDIDKKIGNNDIDILLCIVHRTLEALPIEKKMEFVKEGKPVWFIFLLPYTLVLMETDQIINSKLTNILQDITKYLVDIDFSDDIDWTNFLQNLTHNLGWIDTLKKALKNGSDEWEKVWCIFVRLLKNQIIVIKTKNGFLINSLLSVVEDAFKMGIEERCSAFQCWKVLTDSLSAEANDALINKRINLLITPLKLNNAKVEKVALAKFDAWWHLIARYRNKIDSLCDRMLIPFLHFCFGNERNVKCEKAVFVPGLYFSKLQMMGVHALVEMFGHSCADSCVPETFVKLNSRLITVPIVTGYLKDWMHSFKCATLILAKQYTNDKDGVKKQAVCMWKSYYRIISTLSKSKVRSDLGKELLKVLTQLVLEESKKIDNISDVMYDIIFQLFFDGKNDSKEILYLSSDDLSVAPLHRIMKLVINPIFYNCHSRTEGYAKLQKMFSTALDSTENSEYVINNLLLLNTVNDNTIILWMAFTESMCESKCNFATSSLTNVLLWPLKQMGHLSDGSTAAAAWHKTYCKFRSKYSNKSSIDSDILKLFVANHADTHPIFTIYILSSILKTAACSAQNMPIEKYLKLLAEVLSNINGSELEDAFPVLTEYLDVMTEKVSNTTDFRIAERIILIINNTIKLILKIYQKEDNIDRNHLCSLINKLLSNLINLFRNEAYSKLKYLIADGMIVCTKVNNFIRKCKQDNLPLYNMLINAVSSIEKNMGGDTSDIRKENCGVFIIPDDKKKAGSKNKDQDVVKKVIENGEEYVVVQSKYKFNPKKFTEHQKEKLQKIREDIPALYQDLSQSQDEFKIKAWSAGNKSDSQEPSSNSSNTTQTKDDITSIFKKVSESEIFPNIIENMLGEKNNKKSTEQSHNAKCAEINSEPKQISEVYNIFSPDKSSVKSPRMALKDRVLQNAKKLSENTPATNLVISLIDIGKIAKGSMSKKDSNPCSNITKNIMSELDKKNTTITLTKQMDTSIECDNKLLNDKTISLIELNSIEQTCPDTICENISNKVKQNIDVGIITGIDETCDKIAEEKSTKSINTSIENVIMPNIPKDNNNQNLNTEIKDDAGLNNYNNDKSELLDTTNKYFSSESEQSTCDIPQKKVRKPRRKRIHNQLSIDMVQGNPYLASTPTDKRLTRKSLIESVANTSNSSNDELNDSKDGNSSKPNKGTSNIKESECKRNIISSQDVPKLVNESNTLNCNDLPLSEDVIESSQDSSLSAMPRKRGRPSSKIGQKTMANKLIKSSPISNLDKNNKEFDNSSTNLSNYNRLENNTKDLTAEKEKEPIVDLCITEVLISNNDCSNNVGIHSQETQDIANMDTEPMEASNINTNDKSRIFSNKNSLDENQSNNDSQSGLSSPFRDETQRNTEFLNNTLDISPIKVTSPELKDNHSLLSEKCDSYVTVVLSSPVQSNGEPIDLDDSPEIFTDDKLSPEKRELSPVREVIQTFNNTSPSSLIPLKKNRSQMRSTGRTAQIMSLCQPVWSHTVIGNEEESESKTSNTVQTPVRRNLKTLYNSLGEENNFEDSESFLKLKKKPPTLDSSPSGPILKRKLAEIPDTYAISPASKRKRVSFHDPPVSTTISVQKYIEPNVVKSPECSSLKQIEKPLKTNSKSPRRLKNLFKNLHSLKGTESDTIFSDNGDYADMDTEFSSIEQTPLLEVLKNCDLDDIDPICPELIDCTDPIEIIASELSSPTMKHLLIKELGTKIQTIGDLAKLTELEINRLCIKSPKVHVAHKVLSDYLAKQRALTTTNNKNEVEEIVNKDKQVIDDKEYNPPTKTDEETQTRQIQIADGSMQTDTFDVVSQINESSISTQEIITSCLLNKPDYEEEIVKILSINSIADIMQKKISTETDYNMFHERLIKGNSGLLILEKFLCNNFSASDIVKFSSQLLLRLHKTME